MSLGNIFLSCSLFALAFIKGYEAVPVPTVSTVNDGVNTTAEEPFQDETMNCVLEIFSAVASGNDGGLSDLCQQLLFSLEDESAIDTHSDKEEDDQPSTNPDLQLQLQDLTSQLRAIDADYDVMQDGGEGVKREDAELAEATTGDDGVDVMDGPIASPFVTSLKDINDDFLVIPLKYLTQQAEMTGVMDDDVTMDDDLSPEIAEAETIETESEKNSAEQRDSNETERDGDVDDIEQSLWDMENRDNELNPQNMGALYKVEQDIARLSEDLKRLETKKTD